AAGRGIYARIRLAAAEEALLLLGRLVELLLGFELLLGVPARHEAAQTSDKEAASTPCHAMQSRAPFHTRHGGVSRVARRLEGAALEGLVLLEVEEVVPDVLRGAASVEHRGFELSSSPAGSAWRSLLCLAGPAGLSRGGLTHEERLLVLKLLLALLDLLLGRVLRRLVLRLRQAGRH
ncbi:hypothetical protein M885DRAFT_504911, partial [Pelagophyceae sp. CCMP2097]